MSKLSLKNDRYRKSRGGYSRFLDLSCASCGTHVCYYQKDGPGILKRIYVDRIDKSKNSKQLICSKCKEVLGIRIIYKKERREAYRLFVGAVIKKIMTLTKSQKL